MVFKVKLTLVRRSIVNSRINDVLKKNEVHKLSYSIRNNQDKAIHL